MIINYDDLQVFVITNERSTFPYVRRCLDEQSPQPEVFEIKNMVWVDALNKMVGMCTTKYLIRCDDDFMLHRNAIEFMLRSFTEKETENPNVVMGLFAYRPDSDGSGHKP